MERKSSSNVSGGTTKFSLQLDFRVEMLGLAELFRRKRERRNRKR